MGGSCCSRKSEALQSTVIKRSSINQKNEDNEQSGLKNFKDMEVYSDIEVGNGIFRTKGYKCILPQDKLQELRNQFWNEFSKNIPKYVSLAIRHACVCDTSILNFNTY